MTFAVVWPGHAGRVLAVNWRLRGERSPAAAAAAVASTCRRPSPDGNHETRPESGKPWAAAGLVLREQGTTQHSDGLGDCDGDSCLPRHVSHRAGTVRNCACILLGADGLRVTWDEPSCL